MNSINTHMPTRYGFYCLPSPPPFSQSLSDLLPLSSSSFHCLCFRPREQTLYCQGTLPLQRPRNPYQSFSDDLTKGRSPYGPGGSYNQFAGGDASCAFVFDDFIPASLPAGEVKSIVEWHEFYFLTYIPVNRTVLRYRRNPTTHVQAADAKDNKGKQLNKKVAQEEEKISSCNSRWSQDEGGEVWCDAGSFGGSLYPRLAALPESIALIGKMSMRCGCIERELMCLNPLLVVRFTLLWDQGFP